MFLIKNAAALGHLTNTDSTPLASLNSQHISAENVQGWKDSHLFSTTPARLREENFWAFTVPLFFQFDKSWGLCTSKQKEIKVAFVPPLWSTGKATGEEENWEASFRTLTEHAVTWHLTWRLLSQNTHWQLFKNHPRPFCCQCKFPTWAFQQFRCDLLARIRSRQVPRVLAVQNSTSDSEEQPRKLKRPPKKFFCKKCAFRNDCCSLSSTTITGGREQITKLQKG